jgi:hypothetical protein
MKITKKWLIIGSIIGVIILLIIGGIIMSNKLNTMEERKCVYLTRYDENNKPRNNYIFVREDSRNDSQYLEVKLSGNNLSYAITSRAKKGDH